AARVASFDGVEHALDLTGSFERWLVTLARRGRREEFVILVDEGVFPPEDVTRWPPVRDIRVRFVGHQYRFVAPASPGAHVEFVRAFERKSEATLGAMHGNRMVVFVAQRNSRSLEGPHRTVCEGGLCGVGVVHRNGPRFVASLDRTLLDERFEMAADALDIPGLFADQKACEVHAV